MTVKDRWLWQESDFKVEDLTVLNLKSFHILDKVPQGKNWEHLKILRNPSWSQIVCVEFWITCLSTTSIWILYKLNQAQNATIGEEWVALYMSSWVFRILLQAHAFCDALWHKRNIHWYFMSWIPHSTTVCMSTWPEYSPNKYTGLLNRLTYSVYGKRQC